MTTFSYAGPVKTGTIAGGLVMGWLLTWYAVRPALISSLWILGATWLFYIGAMSFTGHRVVQQQYPFQWVLRAIFICFLVTNAWFYAFDLVMVRWVDPSIAEYRKTEMLRFYENMGEAPDVKEMLQQLRDADFRPGAGTTIFNYFRGAIGGFVIAFFLTWVLRKRWNLHDTPPVS